MTVSPFAEDVNVTFPANPSAPLPEFVLESSSVDKTVHASIDTPNAFIPEVEFDMPVSDNGLSSDSGPLLEVISANDPQFATVFSNDSNYEPPGRRDDFPLVEYVSGSDDHERAVKPPFDHVDEAFGEQDETLLTDDRRKYEGDPRKQNSFIQDRMDALFRRMADEGSSDLHLSVSMPPMVRKDGKMQRLDCAESVLSPEVMTELLHSIMPEKNREEFERRHDTDFAYEIAGLARFRCNVFMDRKGMGAVFRIIPTKILTAEQLGLSKAIMDLCSLSKGLVVVTGPTGSGKSTTLCAMVDSINKSREDHIITIEDPIEFVHDNHKCLVNQREVHNHTDSFKDALRAALREDPDILLVGEMRDLETISIAIETAETGHLVFGTLHTTTLLRPSTE